METSFPPFVPTLTLHEFPRTYGNTFEDEYAFEAIVDGSAFGVYEARLNHRGNIYDTTDAYGVITTPTGTYNCLRIKSTNHTTDSLWYRLFSFTPWAFLSVDEKVSVSYSWMTLETKLAVAEFSYDSIGNPAQFVFSAIPPLTTRIEKLEYSSVNIFPNPASKYFQIEAPKGSLVVIYSTDGRTIFSKVNGENTLNVDCSSWPKGIYMVRLTQNDNDLVEKIMVE